MFPNCPLIGCNAFWLNLVCYNLESVPILDPFFFWASFLKTHSFRSGILHNNDYSLAIFMTGAKLSVGI